MQFQDKNFTTLAEQTEKGERQLFVPKQVNALFEKKFQYKQKQSNWKIPPVDQLFGDYYQLSNLQELKIHLNDVKSKLNDYAAEDWSDHTRRKDPANEIPWRLKNEIKAEFVTTAWCKFYECLHQYPLVRGPKLNSLHLCEAPGAFIAALNHYLHSTYNSSEVQWNWLATTLNPYYEGNPYNKMIADDRFILYTLDRWLFHEDFTGNIIDKGNIQSIVDQCNQRLDGGEVHLITADGSVDCGETPDVQEECVSILHFAEICTALSILADGGCFVIKMFTLFEAASLSKVYLLNCLFDEVNVFKPATSRRGNSELYLICTGFRKTEVKHFPELLQVMLSQLGADTILPVFRRTHIPEDFCIQHITCSRFFMNLQIDAIESNIQSYGIKCRKEVRRFNLFRTEVSSEYINRYKVRPLNNENTILYHCQGTIQKAIKLQIFKGSYTDRLLLKQMSVEEKIFILRSALNELEKSIYWLNGEIANEQRFTEIQMPLTIHHCAPIQVLNSSLFAAVSVLLLRIKLQQIYLIDPMLLDKPHCSIDVASEPVYMAIAEGTFSKNQKDFFIGTLQAIEKYQPQRITFKNCAFLSHYAVSILRYLSANIFDECSITAVPDFEITLKGCIYNEDIHQRLKVLLKTIDSNPNVHCVVEIVKLHHNEFSEAIAKFNNQLLIKNYKLLLDN